MRGLFLAFVTFVALLLAFVQGQQTKMLVHPTGPRAELPTFNGPILGFKIWKVVNDCYRKSSFARVWNSG